VLGDTPGRVGFAEWFEFIGHSGRRARGLDAERHRRVVRDGYHRRVWWFDIRRHREVIWRDAGEREASVPPDTIGTSVVGKEGRPPG
jgi:hypothetical protein